MIRCARHGLNSSAVGRARDITAYSGLSRVHVHGAQRAFKPHLYGVLQVIFMPFGILPLGGLLAYDIILLPYSELHS